MTRIGTTELEVYPLNLGTNVFGWTADKAASFAVLDAYAAAGGNFVDTADMYSQWAPGNSGGESETIIGEWLTARGKRDDFVVATKLSALEGFKGLSAANIKAAAEGSLKRLGTDHIDLYYSHYDDENTPIEETLTAFDALVREGKVRHIAASNLSAARIEESLAISDREGLARYVAIQPHYSLVERTGYETEYAALAAKENLSVLPYWSLAKGFLTGKYRDGGSTVDSPRAGAASSYLDDRGRRVLEVLDEVSAAHETTVAAVALAWLTAQPNVVAPIASARTPEQLADLLPSVDLKLTSDEVAELRAAAEA
ncbi:aldo/keto reductase [Actinokineospora globicatena]|uniref:aldo/keto reductase n=1 Tax=Actinokineospora globicatena TaxID=103729 RepID=UPI0020A4309B|nr:aldo/keto reductase [Actinokineospora globicatena]MCP2301419.1 putative oxidoreductase [Actinokineospora globicatena]GLW76942.1 NADP-dependent aryl-alcohol dehydrogenase [Actinokineospora globicatena]GLW83775.1 NADP-dependent aryl-alcohol dehydrogenase [Actinokineospora globicatena]